METREREEYVQNTKMFSNISNVQCKGFIQCCIEEKEKDKSYGQPMVERQNDEKLIKNSSGK